MTLFTSTADAIPTELKIECATKRELWVPFFSFPFQHLLVRSESANHFEYLRYLFAQRRSSTYVTLLCLVYSWPSERCWEADGVACAGMSLEYKQGGWDWRSQSLYEWGGKNQITLESPFGSCVSFFVTSFLSIELKLTSWIRRCWRSPHPGHQITSDAKHLMVRTSFYLRCAYLLALNLTVLSSIKDAALTTLKAVTSPNPR